MAIPATAIWRVRAGGSALNGGAYDGVAYPTGTDWTKQDAPQATFAGTLSTSAANSTTLLDSANGFSADMVGNAISLASGTNGIVGFYFVTAFGGLGSVTLDRTPATAGALSGGTGRLGGALDFFATILDFNRAVGNKATPGNTIFVRGAGTDNPTVADYTWTGATGTVTTGTFFGSTRILSENGRARIDMNNPIATNWKYNEISGFYFKATALFTTPSGGFFNASQCLFRNNVFDQAGFDNLGVKGSNKLLENEFFSSSPLTGTQPAISFATYNSLIMFNSIHDWGSVGIIADIATMFSVAFNLIANCNGAGISIRNASGTFQANCHSNTCSGNTGNGIEITDTTGNTVVSCQVFNNILANHTGAGKSGFSVAGTQASNDLGQLMQDGNTFYNNTAHQTGLTMGPLSTVLTTDPFISSATQDFRIVPALAATAGIGQKAFGQQRGPSPTSRAYIDPGAVHRQEPPLRRPSLIGVG